MSQIRGATQSTQQRTEHDLSSHWFYLISICKSPGSPKNYLFSNLVLRKCTVTPLISSPLKCGVRSLNTLIQDAITVKILCVTPQVLQDIDCMEQHWALPEKKKCYSNLWASPKPVLVWQHEALNSSLSSQISLWWRKCWFLCRKIYSLYSMLVFRHKQIPINKLSLSVQWLRLCVSFLLVLFSTATFLGHLSVTISNWCIALWKRVSISWSLAMHLHQGFLEQSDQYPRLSLWGCRETL